MTDISNFLNFTETTTSEQVTVTTNLIQCGVCNSTDTQVSYPNGAMCIVCLNCGTTEIQPAPPATTQQQTQAQITTAYNAKAAAGESTNTPAQKAGVA